MRVLHKDLVSITLAALLCAGAVGASDAPDSYLISTYAGGLPNGHPLLTVNAVAIDPAGAVFLSSPSSVFRLDPAGNLVLVAGTGKAGYSGDGGPALSAQLNQPKGLAFDLAGNLYIADSLNQRVRRVSPNGVIATVAGTGSPGDSGGQLNNPQGVAVDTAGDLYIADSANHRVRRVSAGIITTVAGNGAAGDSGDGYLATQAQLNNPRGVAVDTAGNLYIADSGNNRIRMVSTSGVIDTVDAVGSALTNPGSIAVDSAGNLFIADTGSHRILKVSGGAIGTVAAVDAQLDSPVGVAIDSAGNLYIADSQKLLKVTASGSSILAGRSLTPQSHRMAVTTDRDGNLYFTDSDNHRVRKVSPDGDISTVAGDSQFEAPAGLATDRAGNLYIADAGNCRVRKVDTNGVVTPFAGTGSCSAGGDGGPATNASLDPHGLAFDSAGNLYVADRRNNRVRKISPDGIITTVADAQLSNPEGVAVDSAGNLYIADTGNSVVRELSPGGAIRTIPGSGAFGNTGDGGPAIGASLGLPQGVAVDSAGNVFISDGHYAVARRVTVDGVIDTIAGTGVFGYSGDGGPAVNAQLSSPSDIALDAAGNLYLADRLNNAVRILQREGSRPLLTIASAHSGNFAFTVTVSNAVLAAPTSGTVTVTETVPAGLELVSMSGLGWSCSGAVCQRGEPLSGGSSYPPIVVTMNPPSNAPSQLSNVVTVSGGDSVGASTMTTVDVAGPQILTILMTHTGIFAQGQTGGTYSISVTNRGTAPTMGTVAVTDDLPAGLTATAIGGSGWACTLATLTCTRSDAVRAGGTYPPVRVTVKVADNAPASLTNTAAVWGGGAATTSVRNPATIGKLGGRTLHPELYTPLQITTSTVPTVTQYQGYSTTLTASGGTPPYTWSVDPTTGVSLPEGMTLDPATGIVSATQVSGQGGYEVNVLVTDSDSPSPSVANAALDFGVYSDDSYGGCQMFPPDSIFSQRIDLLPVDNTSSYQIPSGYLSHSLHPDFGHGFYPLPGGMPFMRVPANQPATNVVLGSDGQIDPAGTYLWPFPAYPNTVVESTNYGQYGDDHHILILQSSTNSINGPQTGVCTLYETYSSIDVPSMYDAGSNSWSLGAGLHYNLNSDEIATSTDTLDTGAQDSDGMPMVPLLMRYSEVPLGVRHPLRITFPSPTNSWVWPGTGCCSGSGPPQGLLYRLKASVNWQATCPVSTNPQAATLLQALQQYGAYMSDHGSAGYMQAVPDIRWDDDDLACIKHFHVSDLEVVDNSALEVSSISGQTMPYVAPAALPDGTVGTAYSTTLSAIGGAPATRQWSVSSGSLPPGLTLDAAAGTIGGTPSSSTGSPFSFSIEATDTASGYASQARAFSIGVTGSAAAPALAVSSSPTGNFTQGQIGATYSLMVTNSGTGPTSGTVTVTDTLPSGLTATAIAGTGWSCTLATLTCARNDVLPAGSSYLPITLTVNVAANAPASVMNSATVSGGGAPTATDPGSTEIVQLPKLAASETADSATVTAGTSIGFTATVSNSGAAQTGTATGVLLNDPLPAGTGMLWTISPSYSGPGTCGVAGTAGSQSLSCSFGDLVAGAMASVHVVANTSTLNCAAFTNTATASAANSSSPQASAMVTVQCPGLVVSGPSALPWGRPGAAYYPMTATASGGAGPYTWSATGLPAGLTIGANTGAITGTSSSGGTFGVQVTVTDSNSATASRTYSLTITSASPCDTNQDSIVNVLDVQMIINEALGLALPVNDINHDGVVNVLDVQIVVNAALGMGCPAS